MEIDLNRVAAQHLARGQDHAFALRGISLKVRSGEHIAMIGPSGSGKTTILHSIAGLIKPQSGWIKIQNQTWFDRAQNINLSTQQRRTRFPCAFPIG